MNREHLSEAITGSVNRDEMPPQQPNVVNAGGPGVSFAQGRPPSRDVVEAN